MQNKLVIFSGVLNPLLQYVEKLFQNYMMKTIPLRVCTLMGACYLMACLGEEFIEDQIPQTKHVISYHHKHYPCSREAACTFNSGTLSTQLASDTYNMHGLRTKL